MFINFRGNNYAVRNDNNVIIFNAYWGKPIVVSQFFFNRLIENRLTDEDIIFCQKNNLIFEADNQPEKNKHQESIDAYINSYKGPEMLDLIISEICNLKCPACTYVQSKKPAREGRQQLMRLEDIKKWIDFYFQEWIKTDQSTILKLHFGAAEALINRINLKKSLEYIDNTYQYIPKEISVSTNLTLLDEKSLALFQKYKVIVNVGLDGEEETNDQIRGLGNFDLIRNNIAILKKADVPVHVSVNITNQNFHGLNPKTFLRLMRSWKIDVITINLDTIQRLEIPTQELSEKLLSFQKNSDLLGLEIRGDWKTPFDNLIDPKDELTAFCPSMTGKNISVSPVGKLLFCCFSSQVIVPVKVEPAIAFSAFVSSMKTYMAEHWDEVNNKKCLDCPLIGLCAGGCHVIQGQSSKVSYRCEVYRQTTELLLNYRFDQEKGLI